MFIIKKIINVIKRVVMGALLIYTYDSLGILSKNIPINFVTLSLASVFGVFAMFYLVLFSFWF